MGQSATTTSAPPPVDDEEHNEEHDALLPPDASRHDTTRHDASPPATDGNDNDVSLAAAESRKRRPSTKSPPSPSAAGSKTSIRAATFFTVASILAICLVLFQFRSRVKGLLLWLETQPSNVSWLLFILLFTLVSFPMTFGYILLNLAAGYLYGVVYGFLVTAVSAWVGIFVTHVAIRTCFYDMVRASFMTNKEQTYSAILSVLKGVTGLKVVVLTRLTPIPFGLQNALFAVSPLHWAQYLAASAIGLTPTQMMNAYIGSTLRSMEDVLDGNGSHAVTGYAMFIAQMVVSIILMVFVVQSARRQLHRTLTQQQLNNNMEALAPV